MDNGRRRTESSVFSVRRRPFSIERLSLYYPRMKVLMIGDVVARPGRVAVLERIEDLRQQHAVDLAVMNAENVSNGFSITPQHAEQLFAAGVDVMTSGNHIFDKREVVPYIERQPRLLRPANYP